MKSRENVLLGLLSICVGSPAPRRIRRADPQLDTLEGCVVLSRFGFPGQGFDPGSFPGGAAEMPKFGGSRGPRGGDSGRGGPGLIQDAQLKTDLEKLRTDTDAVVAGSTLTDAQRKALAQDLRSLAKAGVRVDPEVLKPVTETLLARLADKTYDSDPAVAQSVHDSFTAIFKDTEADSTLLEQTYADYLTVSRNLNISTDELSTLATDPAAVQADFDRLGVGKPAPRIRFPSLPDRRISTCSSPTP